MKSLTLLASVLAVAGVVYCQGSPNTVADLYPEYHTQASSGVYFLISLDSATAQQLAGDHKLIQAPNFAKGTHPALVWDVYATDIRQGALAIPDLRASQIMIPYVDRLNDGRTPFSIGVRGFMGGTNGNRLGGVVPAVVGTAQSMGGYPLLTAVMNPDDQAYKSINGAQFYSSTKLEVVPNGVSGPGVAPAAIDILFNFHSSQYSPQQLMEVLNQPAVLPSGQCQRINYRFNETFADIRLVSGTVKLYSPALPSVLTGSSGASTSGSKTYSASGMSGNAEFILFPSEDCATAAENAIVVYR